MPQDPVDELRRLKQVDEVWEGTTRLGRMWITPKHRAPYRPWLVEFVDSNGRLPANKVFEDPPTTGVIWEVLAQAMRRPLLGAGRPRRPKMVYFDHAEHVPALTPRLDAIDVRCEFRRNLPTLEGALIHMEQLMNRGQTPLPGLLSIPGITPPLLVHLYTAAAGFFAAAPWRVLNDRHPMEIRHPLDAPPRYAVVMGSGGEVYGLSVHDTLADLQRMYAKESRQDLTHEMSWLVLFYEAAIAMAFDDLDAIAHYGWPVPHEHAYPLIGRTQPGARIGLPTRQDLLWLAGALPACLSYFEQHLRLRHGLVRPAEHTFTIPILGSTTQVYLRLPAFVPD